MGRITESLNKISGTHALFVGAAAVLLVVAGIGVFTLRTPDGSAPVATQEKHTEMGKVAFKVEGDRPEAVTPILVNLRGCCENTEGVNKWFKLDGSVTPTDLPRGEYDVVVVPSINVDPTATEATPATGNKVRVDGDEVTVLLTPTVVDLTPQLAEEIGSLLHKAAEQDPALKSAQDAGLESITKRFGPQMTEKVVRLSATLPERLSERLSDNPVSGNEAASRFDEDGNTKVLSATISPDAPQSGESTEQNEPEIPTISYVPKDGELAKSEYNKHITVKMGGPGPGKKYKRYWVFEDGTRIDVTNGIAPGGEYAKAHPGMAYRGDTRWE